MEAAKFLKNPELVADYQQQYDFFMQALTVENKLRIADRQAVVMDS